MPVDESSGTVTTASDLMVHAAIDCTSALCGSATHETTETIHVAHFRKIQEHRGVEPVQKVAKPSTNLRNKKLIKSDVHVAFFTPYFSRERLKARQCHDRYVEFPLNRNDRNIS